MQKPLVTVDKFHSQFQLSVGKYRDNNNFMEYNSVEAQDDRYLISRKFNYSFLSVTINPSWESETAFMKYESITTDGVKYEDISSEVLFGAYFFLSETKIEHTREVYDII